MRRHHLLRDVEPVEGHRRLLVIWLPFPLPIVITDRVGERESGINVGV
jgi:hypothetical protein